MTQMLVYVLTNKWYRADHLYKVGLHTGDDIKKLIAQYMGRYMPDVTIVKYWRVSDCYTTEAIMHRALNDAVHQYKNEWYQGNITKILDTLNEVVHRCSRDKYMLRVDDRRYPLSYVSDAKLIELGNRYRLNNPYRRYSITWRKAQILLLYLKRKEVDDDAAEALADSLGVSYDPGMTTEDMEKELYNDIDSRYDHMTVADLRAIAKEEGLSGYSRLKKAELIDFLDANT